MKSLHFGCFHRLIVLPFSMAGWTSIHTSDLHVSPACKRHPKKVATRQRERNTRRWFQWFLIFIPAWRKLSSLSNLSNLTMFPRLKPSTSIISFGVSCEAINLTLTPILDVENGAVKETKPSCQPTSYCPTIEEQGNNLCKSPHIFKKFHATFEGFFQNQVVVSHIFSFPYAPCMEDVPTFTINLR